MASLCPLFTCGQNFVQGIADPDILPVRSADLELIDVDLDGDPDLMIAGYNEDLEEPIARLYLNDGSGGFDPVESAPFVPVLFCSIAFADVDADGDPDLVLSGYDGENPQRVAMVYRNNGGGNFSEIEGNSIRGSSDGSVDLADVDGDEDLDLLITGLEQLSPGMVGSSLYLNDGTGVFTETLAGLQPIENGDADFADVDGDGDQDLFISGRSDGFDQVALLYLNDGLGTFTLDENAEIEGLELGTAKFNDMDQDGDPDLLITGDDGFIGDHRTILYENDGSGGFTEVSNTPFVGVCVGTTLFTDLNNDGLDDLYLDGFDENGEDFVKTYLNEGSLEFSEFPQPGFFLIRPRGADLDDVDGDGDVDLIQTGADENFDLFIAYYENIGPLSTNSSRMEDQSFHIYPNPATGAVRIEAPSEIDGIRLIDLSGKTVFEERLINQNEVSLILNGLNAGIYQVEVRSGEERGFRKLVIY